MKALVQWISRWLPVEILSVFIIAFLTVAVTVSVSACPMCLAGRTLNVSAQELVYASHSVLVLPLADGSGFRVVAVIKGEPPAGGTITGMVFRADAKTMQSQEPLLLIRDDDWSRWVNFGGICVEYAPWLRQLAATKRSTEMNVAEWQEHVAFLLPRLEDPEPMVAEIAYNELASAPYPALRSLKPKLNPAQIRRWLDDPKLANRQPGYTLLLGIAGGPAAAEYLEPRLLAAWKTNDASNLAALLAADLELRGPSRVAWIEQKYFRDPRRTTPEIEAAVLALSEQGKASWAIPRARVIEAYRVFLREHPPLAGLVANDLADWECWKFAAQFETLLHSQTQVPTESRAAIQNYLQRCPPGAIKTATVAK